jgi:hypothetical protein
MISDQMIFKSSHTMRKLITYSIDLKFCRSNTIINFSPLFKMITQILNLSIYLSIYIKM